MDGLPKGLPAPGDRGLDNTHHWGRTYWGGALFCLMADIEIDQRTNNRYGLQDALRGIVRAGGNMEQDWPLVRVLKAGDDAVGVPVLTELYERMKATPVMPDLAAMWRELGVHPSGDSVKFDQTAPQALIVRSIMAKRSDPGAACVQVGAHPGSTADSVSVLEIEEASKPAQIENIASPRDRLRVLRLRGTVTMQNFRGRFGLVPWIVSVATVAAIGFGLFHKAVAFSETDERLMARPSCWNFSHQKDVQVARLPTRSSLSWGPRRNP